MEWYDGSGMVRERIERVCEKQCKSVFLKKTMRVYNNNG